MRQYGCNTSSANEPEQSVTYEKDSYVYINSGNTPGGDGEPGSMPPDMLPLTLASEDAANSMRMASDDPFGLQRGMGHSRSGGLRGSSTGLSGGTGLYGSGPMSGGGNGRGGPGGADGNQGYRSHIVRLNSLEPNTVMFNTKDYPILSDVTVPEIIDELEKQFDDKLCELQGVRLVGCNVYICLSRKDSLNYLSTYGFYVRGVPVKVVDITHDSVVICLTGVPHYITDSTITMLVSTFGIAIGEVERRFYKGVDTGERFVRLKPRAHTQVPDFVTVGGCKILIRVLNNEEVCQPYTLQSQEKERRGPGGEAHVTTVSTSSQPTASSLTNLLDHQAFNSQTTASFANSSIVTSSAAAISAGGLSSSRDGGIGSCLSNFRSKPSHCNGSLNSPTGSAGPLPNLSTMSPVPRATDLLLTGITENSESLASPKIAKSFRSRLGLRSPPKEDAEHQRSNVSALGGHDEVDDRERTYIPGDPINDIPSLSPPPYKGPGSTGGSSTTSNSGGRGITGLGLLNRIRGSTDAEDFKTNTIGRKFNRHLTKTDSSNSIGSGGHKSGDSSKINGASGIGGGCNGNNKPRSSVVFEEPMKSTTNASNSSSSTMPPAPSCAAVGRHNNRTVNGILRKGSVPGDDIVTPPNVDKDKEDNRKSNRKAKNSSSGGSKNNKKSAKLESVTESGLEDGDSSNAGGTGKDRSSRSRSSSSKTSSKADKAAKDLALTRDLPWCGCWGNGCL